MKRLSVLDLLLVTLVTLQFVAWPISGQLWNFQPIGDGWQSDSNMELEDYYQDFRFINFDKLQLTGSQFKHPDLVSFVQMVVDEDRHQLLVGGRDKLYRLRLEDLRELEIKDVASDSKRMETCTTQGHKQADCHNFIRVLSLSDKDGTVFVCGTNSFYPKCSYRNATDLDDVKDEEDGMGVCPHSPHYNATYLRSANGDLYTATVIDKAARDAAIVRSPAQDKTKYLRTMPKNSFWLDQPNFVSAYEIGEFVYFFFRETAVEYINCGKRIYSRVARVCKHDKGGGRGPLAGLWTTFYKARLNCSLPGLYPFYFDELQSTYYSSEEGKIYAVFTTPPNGMPGSAVCVYNMTAIQHAFEGPFKHQEGPEYKWVASDKKIRHTCEQTNNGKRSAPVHQDLWMDAMNYQLMDRAVQPGDRAPIVMRENERWTHIVVDHVPTDRSYNDVVFLATETGKLRKMVRVPESDQTCLVEEIKIVENGLHRPVRSMKLSTKQRSIYISTPGSIVKVPVQRCYRFTNEQDCVNANDPYCGWNSITQECSPAPQGNIHENYWLQDFSQCPVLDYQVHGGWSEWSSWDVCKQVGHDDMVDRCLCRSRSCDNPRPANNGRKCYGTSMEITNCTVDGQWTAWSAWGACTQTCGWALKSRTRQCGNPQPKFGGSNCVGESEETVNCNLDPCPMIHGVDGEWSVWSGWSTCTSNCNGGMQTRKRGCLNPTPDRGGKDCIGNSQEWRSCNGQRCEELTKHAPWTDWVETNRTNGGYWQQRFRFTCRANVETSKQIKTSYVKSQSRFCLDEDERHNKYSGSRNAAGGSRDSCFKPRELANTVTSIDTFSAVDRSLKKFCRSRRRLFKKYCSCRTLGIFLVCQKCKDGPG